jgi:hypothetical protein
MRKLLVLIPFLASAALAQSYPKVTYYGGLAHALQRPNSGTFFVSEDGEDSSFEPCGADGADILGPNLQHSICSRRDFHGIDGSVKFNISRFLGVRTDVAAMWGKTRAVDTFGDGADMHTDTNVFHDRTLLALAGIELADNAATRWRPFAHVMAGVARQTSNDVQTSTGPFNFELRDRVTSFTLKIGGGIDLPVTPHLDVRVIEADYAPIFARSRHTPGNADFDQSVKGRTAQNVTFGFGLVLH